VIRLYFWATNIVVEYEALINDLLIAAELEVQRLYIRADSELVVNRVMGESNYHDTHVVPYSL
jgi:ribonuclease HI